MPEADVRTKMLAALGLVCVSSTVGVLYKISQSHGGGFKYSTTAAIAIAEIVKFCMSLSFHLGDRSHHNTSQSKLVGSLAAAKSQLSKESVFHIWVLAAVYTTNNQLSFYVYKLADPGTIFLFKAASTMIVATIQCLCLGKKFSSDQWKAMGLQGIGMVIVQYNPCKSDTRYNPLAYVLMSVSAVLSALCAVRNEYIVKNYRIGLNVQNMTLYAGGTWMNILAFIALPNPNSSQAGIGFFDGFGNPLACGVVFANAVIGLAITAVYKYADAITKCIASDITAVLLCIISSIFFELEGSVTMWCGVFVVCFAVHSYTTSAPPPAASVKEKDKAPDVDLNREALEEKTSSLGADAGETGTLVGKPAE